MVVIVGVTVIVGVGVGVFVGVGVGQLTESEHIGPIDTTILTEFAVYWLYDTQASLDSNLGTNKIPELGLQSKYDTVWLVEPVLVNV